MRELTFQTLIAGCSVKEFYQIACTDKAAITRFHKEVNKDETVVVSDWSADGQRMVEFTLAMAIPASVQRFVGAGPMRIKEQQMLTWQDDQTLKIVSIPELQISYAKALRTQAELMIGTVEQGVIIDVVVKVTAAVPWPMQSTVEAIMADQAKKTVGQYVEYIGGYVESAMEEINNQRQLQEQQVAAIAAEGAAATAALEADHVEQQLALAAPPSQPVAIAAAAVTPAPATPIAAVVPRLAAAATAAAEPEMFYDANEIVPGSTLDLLLKELREAREARQEANRLLLSIKDSLQHVDQAVSRELAFQEGVRYGQRFGSTTLLLSVAMAAAAASATTMFLLTRRSTHK